MPELLKRCLFAAGAFFVTWLVVMFLLERLFGVHPAFATFATIIGIVPALYVLKRSWPVHAALDKSKIVVFGEALDRPAFFERYLARNPQPLDARVFWEGQAGGITQGSLTITPRTDLNQRRLFEALLESARLLSANRGNPITDRLDNVIWPEIFEEGILVEEIENDDGSRSMILATGFKQPLTREEWTRAYGSGFGRWKSAWTESPVLKARVTKRRGNGSWSLDSTVMPLFHLDLTERVLAGSTNTAPTSLSVGIDLPHDLPR